MRIQERYTQASKATRAELQEVAHSQQLQEISKLTLPQIDAAVNLVSQMVPAGSIPRVILNGLVTLPGRKLSPETAQRDTHLLLESLENLTVYSAAFAMPAAVIWGYQNLLKLAGKDPDSAFPQGTWQFYVNYALREDTARHTNETNGFDALLSRHDIRLTAVQRMAAWVMAGIYCLHQYDDLLRNEWRERVYLREVARVMQGDAQATRYQELYCQWERVRPYGRGRDAQPHHDFPAYRRVKFNAFLEKAMSGMSSRQRREWVERVRVARENELPAYQQQMSILNSLHPDQYAEQRQAIPLEWAHVGLIYRGCYYLIPACASGSAAPAAAETVMAQVMAILENPAPPSHSLVELARTQRAAIPQVEEQLSPAVQEEWEILHLAPIMLNFDRQSPEQSLAALRQAERGIGSHAMTIFDTGKTFVFDQSHIFFDGAWGAALAEVLTNEALSWAVYLHGLPPAIPAESRPTSLAFPFTPAEEQAIAGSPKVMAEVNAETTTVNLKALLHLRRLFKLRNDLIHLTVNDLLILFRAIHAGTYRPDPDLLEELHELATRPATRLAAESALRQISNSEHINPAMLIPVDASQFDPRDRVHPISFIVPLRELGLISQHHQATEALAAYRQEAGDRAAAYASFDEVQRRYLASLAGCGAVFHQAKRVAAAGQSTSVGSIRLLAHLPPALQQMLDGIPGRFEVLNDIIKGREVFSNIGAVAPNSSLTRFMTAKDDNEMKNLAWGVLTDAQQKMHITLRDFRPHVRLLIEAGQKKVAERITADFLNSYARALNQYVMELQQITLASRETRLSRGVAHA